MPQSQTQENMSISKKSKLIGVLIISTSTVLLWLIARELLQIFSLIFVVLGLIIPLVVYIPALIVGFKLIRYPHEIQVSIETIRERVQKSQIQKKRPEYPAVVYFCGIDGSGKTTQIQLIKKGLLSRKLECSHVNLRFAAFFSYPFFAFCRIFGFTKWKKNSHGTWVSEYYFYRNKALSKLYSWLFTLDLYLRSSLVVKRLLWRGHTVLCDRCSIDGLVDLMADTRDFDLSRKAQGRLLLSLISYNSSIILFDADEHTAFMRKKDITNIQFLMARRKLYLDLVKRMKIHVINANKLPLEMHSELVSILSHKPFWYFTSDC